MVVSSMLCMLWCFVRWLDVFANGCMDYDVQDLYTPSHVVAFVD